MTKTIYGKKRQGTTKFVIVAPHGAGDDMFTAELAEEISDLLDASLVANTKVRRKETDFNKLTHRKGRQHSKEMRQFYKDIDECCEEARPHGQGEHKGKKRALVVYIHGMKDQDD